MSALLMPPPGNSNAHRGAFFLEARGASNLGENFGLMTMDLMPGSFVHTRIVGTARSASTPPPAPVFRNVTRHLSFVEAEELRIFVKVSVPSDKKKVAVPHEDA